MKGATHSKRVKKRHKSPARDRSETHHTGAPTQRLALPEVEVFADSPSSPEVEAATRDLRHLHDAQVADDDFQ